MNLKGDWDKIEIKKFDFPLWKISWSHCGTYLAVCGGDNIVNVFSENVNGKFEEVSKITPESNQDLINRK